MSCLLSSDISTTFALYMVRALLMSPMKEEMTKFTWMKLHSLPRDSEVWTKGLASVEGRSWTSSSLCGGSVLGFPQYGSSCLWKDDDLKNCQLLLSVCSRICAAAKYAHVYKTSQHLAELRIWE